MKVFLPDVFFIDNTILHILTDNTLSSNWYKYKSSKKDGKHYSNILKALNIHSIILVDPIL